MRHEWPQEEHKHTFTPRGSARVGVSVLSLQCGQSGSSIETLDGLIGRCLAHASMVVLRDAQNGALRRCASRTILPAERLGNAEPEGQAEQEGAFLPCDVRGTDQYG